MSSRLCRVWNQRNAQYGISRRLHGIRTLCGMSSRLCRVWNQRNAQYGISRRLHGIRTLCGMESRLRLASLALFFESRSLLCLKALS